MAKELEGKVLGAIDTSRYVWRTAEGIAREIRLPEPVVCDVLTSNGDVIRARGLSKSGRPLYTTRKRYTRDVSLAKRIIGAATNRIAE